MREIERGGTEINSRREISLESELKTDRHRGKINGDCGEHLINDGFCDCYLRTNPARDLTTFLQSGQISSSSWDTAKSRAFFDPCMVVLFPAGSATHLRLADWLGREGTLVDLIHTLMLPFASRPRSRDRESSFAE